VAQVVFKCARVAQVGGSTLVSLSVGVAQLVGPPCCRLQSLTLAKLANLFTAGKAASELELSTVFNSFLIQHEVCWLPRKLVGSLHYYVSFPFRNSREHVLDATWTRRGPLASGETIPQPKTELHTIERLGRIFRAVWSKGSPHTNIFARFEPCTSGNQGQLHHCRSLT
jgi:hypothetical protein